MAEYLFYELETIAKISRQRVPLFESEYTVNNQNIFFSVIAEPLEQYPNVINRTYAMIYMDEFIPMSTSKNVYPIVGAKYASLVRKVNGFDTVYLGVRQDDN